MNIKHALRLPANTPLDIVGKRSLFMSTQELGKALTQARTARGLTLIDVERDTRISLKYIKALEDGEIETLPAPVYARAFMRTYAQYLGLNARDFVQRLPGSRPEPELPPLPDVTREAGGPLIAPSWIVAGAIVVLLVAVGVVLFWGRGGDGGSESVRSQPTAQGQGAEQPTQALGGGQPIDVSPGVVPDLREQNVLAAVHALDQAGLEFFVIEVDNSDKKELVFQQSPSPGTPLSQGGTVTLVVGR
jgi:transcriptional regulator with XRE-family HTH domain